MPGQLSLAFIHAALSLECPPSFPPLCLTRAHPFKMNSGIISSKETYRLYCLLWYSSRIVLSCVISPLHSGLVVYIYIWGSWKTETAFYSSLYPQHLAQSLACYEYSVSWINCLWNNGCKWWGEKERGSGSILPTTLNLSLTSLSLFA
jgi:hypothetical protein